VSRQAERLGVQFIILDESMEVVDLDQLCEAPQFAAAVERIVRRGGIARAASTAYLPAVRDRRVATNVTPLVPIRDGSAKWARLRTCKGCAIAATVAKRGRRDS
jgi:hypothetical protein